MATSALHRKHQADYVHSVLALNPVIFDVRSPAEWKAGHMKGAIHVPVGEPPLSYDEMCRLAAAIGSASAALDRVTPVAVYCKKGVRSELATALLRATGMTQVYDLGGAIKGPLAEYRKS